MPCHIPVTKSILFTGGIGDVLAIESFLSDEQRNKVETFYYATRAHKTIRDIFSKLPNYPNLKKHVILWEDFSNIFAFYHKNDVLERINPNVEDWHVRIAKYNRWMELLRHVDDYSISMLFPQCNKFMRPYNKSSFLTYKIANIDHLCLPGDQGFLQKEENAKRFEVYSKLFNDDETYQQPKFIALCPYTINDRRHSGRDFSDHDWNFIKTYLRSKKCFGVVLNIGDDPIPEDPLIINLSNKTSFLESVEILKKANGYVGIDSCLSVLAVKLFEISNIMIKSNNGHCYMWAGVYYAPHQNATFLMRGFHNN